MAIETLSLRLDRKTMNEHEISHSRGLPVVNKDHLLYLQSPVSPESRMPNRNDVKSVMREIAPRTLSNFNDVCN